MLLDGIVIVVVAEPVDDVVLSGCEMGGGMGGMGGGMAASRADNPWQARGLGLAAHVVFGFGLYLSALALPAA